MERTLTVTAKGQITLRKDVLAHLGIRPGDRLEVELLPNGRLQLQPARKKPMAHVFGMLAHRGSQPLSVDDINEIAAEGWAGRESDR
ncbi:MAG: AbrB/MazE/SpoVT family DNA-binding domain-containing protein [Gammaproteobacteria bacterium]|jgi:AbrB family looped-hinge helix DNA binding protein|nr:AbrB/MazE/SpoVT family DNA-binding domain-containing protein [Gammaproteobacteria bacterium]